MNLQKNIFLLLAIIFSLRANSYESLSVSPVLKIEQSGSLFEKPSGKAKILADVGNGVPVLGRALSTSGEWILLEDESGFQGWFPTKWTNWTKIQQESLSGKNEHYPDIPMMPLDEANGGPKYKLSSENSEQADGPSWYRGFELGLARDWPLNDNAQNAAVDADFPLIFTLGYAEAAAQNTYGLQFNWGYQQNFWGLDFLGRYFWSPSIFRALDLGFQKSWNSDKSKVMASFGVSLGVKFGSNILLAIRGGLLSLHDTQWNLGGRLAWHF